MPASVTFEDNEAEFEASEADERAALALCDLLEEAGRGRMTLIELASRLRELTEAAPEHIDARAHLGSVLLESEQLQEAAAEYERAFEIGSKALPTDFDGRIEWIRLDNRPFLRAAYGLALVRLKTGKRTEAIRLMEQLLRWNPNDNQGVRLSIGSEYLRAGHRAKAGRVLREHADEYPPYRYELGLLHLQKQKWAEAATSLRRGFVDNSAEFSSIRQVHLWLCQEGVELPAVVFDQSQRRVVWKLPGYTTVHRILTNPVYAGAYAFGRTGSRTYLENGRKRVVRGFRRERDEWEVLIRDQQVSGSSPLAGSSCSP